MWGYHVVTYLSKILILQKVPYSAKMRKKTRRSTNRYSVWRGITRMGLGHHMQYPMRVFQHAQPNETGNPIMKAVSGLTFPNSAEISNPSTQHMHCLTRFACCGSSDPKFRQSRGTSADSAEVRTHPSCEKWTTQGRYVTRNPCPS